MSLDDAARHQSRCGVELWRSFISCSKFAVWQRPAHESV